MHPGAAPPAREGRQCSRPMHSLYRDPRGPGGQGPARESGAGQGATEAGQGFRGRPGGQHGTWERNDRNEDILSRYFCESSTQAWDQCTVL